MNTPAVAEKRKLLVLVVEDNVGDAYLVIKFLKGIGVPVQVVVMRDGSEALDYLGKKGAYLDNKAAPRPDLIFLDLHLPTVDGKEVLKEIKSSGDLRDIPVIVLSGSNSQHEILDCYESSADYYLVKPDSLTEFVEAMKYVVRNWLQPLTAPSPDVRA